MKESYWLPERLFWSAYLATRTLRQKDIPFWPREKLEKVQNSRIRKIIRFASRNVPYYRELFHSRGFRYEDFQTMEDIYRLPVIHPLQVRRNPDQFRPDRISLDIMKLASSGTTGVPRWIHHDAVSILSNAAHGERSRFFFSKNQKNGRNFREAQIIPPLGAAGQEVRNFTFKKTILPRWIRPERNYFSMLDDMESIIGRLNEFKPHVMRAYGSVFNMLFEELVRSGRELNFSAALVYSADSMAPALKRRVMEELGIPVFSEYNCVECLQLGFECQEHRGYHLHEDSYPVRIVDDEYKTLPDGAAGRVIVSNLINRANVLLNYELGDEATILPDQCGCGRTLRMLSLNLSRVADRITLKDGSQIHPITFAEVVYHEKDLWQHQVVHFSENEFEVFLVAAPWADKAAMKQRLTAEFEKWFQGTIRFQLRFVDQIEMTPGGKQRAVVFRDQEEKE